MVQFRDLPNEIIDKITSYISNEILEKLFNVPILGDFAKNRVYSTVFISNSKMSIYRQMFYLEKSPLTMNLSEYLEFMKRNPGISPKRMIFELASDALELIQSCPGVLKNVKVELKFNGTSSSDPLFVHNYLKEPFYVDSIETNRGHEFDEYLCLLLTRNVKSLSIVNIGTIDLKSISGIFFSQLTYLNIHQELDADDFCFLPSKLKVFLGSMKYTDSIQMRLNFPTSLEKLHLRIENNDKNIACEFDISYLTKLYDAKIESDSAWRSDQKLLGIWKLPRNLRKLSIHLNRMIYEDLALMCPQLVELKILDFVRTDNKDFLQALSIPKTVKDLRIPYSYLSYKKHDLKLQFLKDNPVLRSRVKFPDGLIKLAIRGCHDIRRAIALDFHFNKLSNLEELSLFDTGHTLSFGNFPKSLRIFKQKNFTNCGVGGIFTPRSLDFKKFQNLDNLREFNLQGISKSRDFFYKFPDSLERLVCPDNGITRVRIYGDGIEYLDLSGNRLSNLNEANFVIPEEVKELNLSYCYMYSIRAKFPDCLQKLDLKGNSLDTLDNLPDNLRYLDCQRNKLGDGNLVCNFPIGLEWLNLESNPLLRPDLIADSNLSQCTRLKFLSLSLIEMNSLDLNSLPHSLTRLNLSECRLMSFVGTFARFQDLEDINLNGNCLKGYFYKTYNSYGILFGNKIKMVRLLQNSLLTLDVEVLRNELSRKSTFKKLEINNKLIEQPNPTENYQVETSPNNEISGLAMTRPTKQRKLNP